MFSSPLDLRKADAPRAQAQALKGPVESRPVFTLPERFATAVYSAVRPNHRGNAGVTSTRDRHLFMSKCLFGFGLPPPLHDSSDQRRTQTEEILLFRRRHGNPRRNRSQVPPRERCRPWVGGCWEGREGFQRGSDHESHCAAARLRHERGGEGALQATRHYDGGVGGLVRGNAFIAAPRLFTLKMHFNHSQDAVIQAHALVLSPSKNDIEEIRNSPRTIAPNLIWTKFTKVPGWSNILSITKSPVAQYQEEVVFTPTDLKSGDPSPHRGVASEPQGLVWPAWGIEGGLGDQRRTLARRGFGGCASAPHTSHLTPLTSTTLKWKQMGRPRET
ncbi:hypothetical protein AAFF_G00048960 [Aldrovandia affinis]|uniref:Uncharacterized protein n=1 Tax=Aldrovandia affinis TaxID=143900 RepID=A0AAD7WEH1_9TELE|nr:hypothetical protein AAFF_G00048960 [Aldrovandia affinis]